MRLHALEAVILIPQTREKNPCICAYKNEKTTEMLLPRLRDQHDKFDDL